MRTLGFLTCWSLESASFVFLHTSFATKACRLFSMNSVYPSTLEALAQVTLKFAAAFTRISV